MKMGKMGFRVCQNCGTELTGDDSYCGDCGKAIPQLSNSNSSLNQAEVEPFTLEEIIEFFRPIAEGTRSFFEFVWKVTLTVVKEKWIITWAIIVICALAIILSGATMIIITYNQITTLASQPTAIQSASFYNSTLGIAICAILIILSLFSMIATFWLVLHYDNLEHEEHNSRISIQEESNLERQN